MNSAIDQIRLGNDLAAQGNLSAAADCFREAIALCPDLAEAHSDLGFALEALKRYDDSIACARRAVELEPDSPFRHMTLAFRLLLLGRMVEAWPHWPWRLQIASDTSIRRQFAQPTWQGEDLIDRTILVDAGEGFGDCFQFARYVPLLAQRGANVILCCRPDVKHLFVTLAGAPRVITFDDPIPAFDFHATLDNLPGGFNTTLETIPAAVPYLHADANRVAQWKQRLAAAGDGILNVGLVWAGSPKHLNDRHRSIPLATLATLAGIHGVRLVNLQKGKPIDVPGMVMVDFTSDLHDFADTAALVDALDLVISVDTSVAHLAGALAKPVWLLLPHIAEFRWMLDRTDSPWYPTMRLFRQSAPRDWDGVVNRVGAELQRSAAPFTGRAPANAPQAGPLNSAQVHYDRAESLRRAGQMDAAIDALREATRLRPGFVDAWINLANALRATGRTQEATAAIRRAIEIQPNLPRAHMTLGVLLADQGDLPAAIASHRRAIELDPAYVLAHHNLGNALLAQNELEAAIAAFRRVTELAPGFAPAQQMLARALSAAGRLA